MIFFSAPLLHSLLLYFSLFSSYICVTKDKMFFHADAKKRKKKKKVKERKKKDLRMLKIYPFFIIVLHTHNYFAYAVSSDFK